MSSKMKILIVDDDVHIAELISLYLDKEGYETKEVYSGKTALQVFSSFAPHLVILDIMLHYFRDILVMLETGNENMLINSDKRDIIISNARGYRSRRVIECIRACEETRRALKSYANFTFAIDNLLNKFRED